MMISFAIERAQTDGLTGGVCSGIVGVLSKYSLDTGMLMYLLDDCRTRSVLLTGNDAIDGVIMQNRSQDDDVVS